MYTHEILFGNDQDITQEFIPTRPVAICGNSRSRPHLALENFLDLLTIRYFAIILVVQNSPLVAIGRFFLVLLSFL